MTAPQKGTTAREAEEYLAGVYETCTGFELAVVTSVEPSSRNALRERLVADGAELRVLAPTVEALVEAPRVDASLGGHRQWVLWFEAEDDDEATWRAFAVALNRAREQLRANHAYLWVLAGPLALRRWLTVHAQDIHSIAYKAPHIAAHAGAHIDWLHLTDLHLRAVADAGQFDAFSSDLQRTLDLEQLSVDVVLISGDLTATGETAEFARVDQLLASLGEVLTRRTGVAPIVMAVPGNHDLLRRNARTMRRYDPRDEHVDELRELLWVKNDAGFLAPLFEGYLDWARRRIWARAADPIGMQPGVCHLRERCESFFPGDGAMVVEKDDLRVAIVGLNTAWTCYRAGDRGELAVEQFDAAFAGLKEPQVHTRVLVTHHGVEQLAHPAIVPKMIELEFALHVHGHQHGDGLPTSSTAMRTLPVGGPPLFGARAPRAYTLGRLEHEERVRVWSPGRRVDVETREPSWGELLSVDELQSFRDQAIARAGDVEPAFERRWSPMVVDHPPPWTRDTYPSHELFVRARWHGSQVVVLRGPRGSGKTTLLRSLARMLAHEGPDALGLAAGTLVVWPSWDELASSRNLAALVQSIAGDVAPDFGGRLCARGRLLVIVDGLPAGLDWLQREVEGTRDGWLLVTAEAQGQAAVDGGYEALLCPLDDRQVVAALREQVEAQAEAVIDQLFEPSRGVHERILELARWPEFMRWLVIAARSERNVFEDPSTFFGICTDVPWRSTNDELVAALREPLAALAAQIHQVRGRRWIADSEVDVVHEGVHVDRAWLLEQLFAHGDHLVRRGSEIGFAQLAIQECLTAHWWRLHAIGRPNAWSELAARFDDEWWQEVIVLLLDEYDFEALMHALVRRPEFPNWSQTAMMRRCATGRLASSKPFVVAVHDAELGDTHRAAAARILMQYFPDAATSLPPLQLGLVLGPAQPPRLEADGGLELVLVPGGRARIGSDPSEPDHRPDEGPVHEVELEPFYIAPTPVTNADYARYLRCNPDVAPPRYWSDHRFNQPMQPVVGVSWAEASAYCEWAGLALPTEVQWEYACRAGAATRFGTGDDEGALVRVAWYAANAAGKLQVARTREPNPLGIFDLHGNVREWCRDDFGSYRVSPRPGDGLRHPPRPEGSRVHRGGGFSDPASELRCAARGHANANYRLDALGFRPVSRVRAE